MSPSRWRVLNSAAQIMAFEDLKENGNESAVKAAGKYRQQGKT